MSLTAYIGTVAAFCTTVAFVPQIVKLRKQGGEDLSYHMLFLYLTGVLLWLAYGIRVHAVAVIWANALAGLMVLISIVLKANPPAKKLNLESGTLESGNPAPRNARSRRLRIAVDMDEVIADSFSKHLSVYNQLVGANLTTEIVSKKGLGAVIPHDRRDQFAAIPHGEGFFNDLEVIEGSREALLELSRHHDIFIASAAMEVPTSFDAKYKWLQKHFTFIPTSRIVFCGDKNIVDADILVDDRSRHFADFRGTGILFTAPHNAGESAELRANSWNDVLRILQGERSEAAAEEPLARTLSMNPAG
ncbi:MAG: PQ-loop domain-containing transporter [Terriglobales bacterium]|jgi:5'-nucleotidase